MTRDEFESSALHRLQLLYPQARFLRAGQLEIAVLRGPSGQPTTRRLRLAGAWAAFCQNGERFDLDSYLNNVIGTIEHRVPAEWAAARPTIFPKLLTSGLMRRHQHAMFYPLAGDVGYVLSCGEHGIWLTEQHLKMWNVAEEWALAAGLENLGKLWSDATVVAWTIQDNIRAFHLEVTHSHKAAFVLAPEFMDRATELLRCEEVSVAIPNRNFLVAFAAGDEEFRQILQPIVAKEMATGYPLNKLLLRIGPSGYSTEPFPLS